MNNSPALQLGFAVPIFANPGVPDFRTPNLERLSWAHIVDAVTRAEHLGYESLWVADHMFLGRGGAILEGWTTLSVLAGITSKIRLGTIHLGNPFRHAPLTAKMAATLDVVSNGRLELFIDPAWRERELVAYGYAWEPDRSIRVAQLSEALDLMKLMWTAQPVSFSGQYYKLDGAICAPSPIRPAGPRIWIGEAFDEATLDLIVRHADVWNSMPAGLDVLREKIARVDQACVQRGRDPTTLAKTLETQVLVYDDAADAEALFRHFASQRDRYPSDDAMRDVVEFVRTTNPNLTASTPVDRMRDEFLVGTPDEIAAKLTAYAAMGVTELICWFMDFPRLESMQRLATEIAPRKENEAA